MNIIQKLQSKAKKLSEAQLKESLQILKNKTGPDVALVWQSIVCELELKMGEDAFWLWADSGDLF